MEIFELFKNFRLDIYHRGGFNHGVVGSGLRKRLSNFSRAIRANLHVWHPSGRP